MGYEVVGVFLQGSQNYELDYEGSDIDCKAILLPKFEDFVLNNKAVSTTHVLENNEHIDLKDIRLMFDYFKKQNINFVEILFTRYKIINPKYAVYMQKLFDNNERLAHYNNYASLNCIAGTSMEKYKALEHPYPTIVDKIEKYGYDPKQLHHIIRLNEFIKRYIAGEKYSGCLISKDKEYEIKTEPMGNYARYYLIDNYGDKMYLTKGEVKTKFKRNKKEDIFL
jgi:predicted nucleotidyltransferase